ncbi:hypothetical protein [Blastopirellula marina]|uniref:Transmembrane protein n=1 Tax=Blastopirellula marina DSM 3645 TaxID=314230 RepID=A3ZNE3_9BACT|nr:hypothetical protein [Blastopirellula marina]EAQ81838.1 hypothetical protein DSM3645_16840 [Blastopirellula marina DSM 3645]
MNPLHLCIALCPLAAYMFLLGAINLSRRPFLTTGGRDSYSLGVAVVGLVIAGPMKLFLPDNAAALFGPYIWLLMLSLYFLAVTFWVLMERPRLVVFNSTIDQLKPVLRRIANELDSEARWSGDAILFPSLGIHLVLEESTAMRNVQINSVGARQDFLSWRRFELALGGALRRETTTPNPYGAILLTIAVSITVVVMLQLLRRPDLAALEWRELMMF